MHHRFFCALLLLSLLTACERAPDREIASQDAPVISHSDPKTTHAAAPNLAVKWVQQSAEFEALALQAYAEAEADLAQYVADTSWSALPWQTDAASLPPAIITDVDETMVSNVEFQADYERPFTNHKLDRWNDSTVAVALPGAVEFVRHAKAAGVRVFFLTNRPCEILPGIDDPCPQKAVTVQDLNEAGFETDADSVLLSHETPDWDREKSIRRHYIAQTHRVIMLIGDDLGDFIPCTRANPLAPCTEGATVESRSAITHAHARYWGNGWYILPNPMHGSWTSIK